MKSFIAVLFTLLLLPVATTSDGKAFCALRDPVSQIYHFFPEADNYRSIVRTVDESTRQQVAKHLPHHQLHIDELGRHTLYVALKNKQPIGIVHVRSEHSRWGLIEIAWALDLHLNVIDFNFQRSRAVGTRVVQTQQFKNLIIGKDFPTLNLYLNQQGNVTDTEFNQAAQNANSLAKAVLVNGLKTLLVTQFAWAKEIKQLRTKV